MHARLTTFNMGPGKRDVATSMADEALKMSKGMDGFVSATYLILDEAAGDYGSLTVWETEDAANAAADTLKPWFADKLGPHTTAPPVFRIAEVYTPD